MNRLVTIALLLASAFLASGCQKKPDSSACVRAPESPQPTTPAPATSVQEAIALEAPTEPSSPPVPGSGPPTSIQFIFIASEPLEITHDAREPINTPGRYNMKPGTATLRIRRLGGEHQELTATLETLPITSAVADYTATQGIFIQLTGADLDPPADGPPIRKSIGTPHMPPLPVAVLTVHPIAEVD